MTSKQVIKLSTEDLPIHQRNEWLREVIGREYSEVEITPPADGDLFNEMMIYPRGNLRLSSIRSSEITLERLRREPESVNKDAYFAVVLLSGVYRLRQNGKEIFLNPGDIALYDVTQAHQIRCPERFSKLIISIPRSILEDRFSGAAHCTGLRIPGNIGIGCVASTLIQSMVAQASNLDPNEFGRLSDYTIDVLTLALSSVRPSKFFLSGTRSLTLNRIKGLIERNLSSPELNTAMVSEGIGLSSRYINRLFRDEDTSLMRFIWRRRLENCRGELLDPLHVGRSITDIALHWGFNDVAHFSRVFKRKYGCSPREYRKNFTCVKPYNIQTAK